jgi:hypothetical protein
MADVLALEAFVSRACAPLLGVGEDQLRSFVGRPTSTLKLKRFASDPRSPVLFLTLITGEADAAYGKGMTRPLLGL